MLLEEVADIGCDETEGRYADVSCSRCKRCSRLWLWYQVDYEAFSRSGRWARGLINAEDAQAIQPSEAASYLERLEWHIRGGSYFNGLAKKVIGKARWGI